MPLGRNGNDVFEVDWDWRNLLHFHSGGMDSEKEGLHKLFHCISPPRFAAKRACYGLMVILFFVAMLRYQHGPDVLQSIRPGGSLWRQGEKTVTLDLSHLEKYELSTSFSYSRRSIDIKRADGVRPWLTSVNESLFSIPQVRLLAIARELTNPTCIVEVESVIEGSGISIVPRGDERLARYQRP